MKASHSVQVNALGATIVCKGIEQRNSYRVIHTGTYADCVAFGAGAYVAHAAARPVLIDSEYWVKG